MESPLAISFHNVTPTEAIERQIQAHAERLARLHPHMTGMRVAVDLPHRHKQSGNIWEVHIEMSLPGYGLAVTQAPHHPEARYAEPDLETSLRDAFAVAERKLKEEVEKRGPRATGRRAAAIGDRDTEAPKPEAG